jgi:uncharacterized protein YegJ (DUF2314 family)
MNKGKEPASNLVLLCRAHGREMPQTMEHEGTLWVKVKFPIPDHGKSTENMWVQVESMNSRVGILGNDPAYIDYVKDGDLVNFMPDVDGRMVYVGLLTSKTVQ